MSWGWVFATGYVVSVGLLLLFMRGACVDAWWEDVQDDIDSLPETEEAEGC